IVDNHRVRSLWPLDEFLTNNRPVGLYSFAVNYHFSGVDPFYYHVVNMAIHLINGLLVLVGYLLSWRLYRRHWCDQPNPEINYGILATASLIATLWVVHPLTTQAVTNVVQRYESLASMGYLGVWVGMLIYLCGRRIIGCVVIFLMAWIGLMSKEVFVTAPLAVLLFDRLITKHPWSLIFKTRLVPIALMLSPNIWFIPSVARFFDTSRTGSSMGFGMEKVSSWEYLRTQPEVIWHYLYLTVWPRQLAFDYVWRIQSNPWIYLSLGATILALIAIGARAYWQGGIKLKSFSSGLAGWLVLTFFFILAPTSSIVPIADLAFEHRMYLATALVMAGIVFIARAAATRLLSVSERPAVLRAGLVCFAVAAVSLLAWRTHLRNQDYRDGLRLWQTALDVSPKNPRAWYNVGREYYHRGDKDAALQPMANAVGYSTSGVPMYVAGLADCLNHHGRVDDAITLYERALSKKSNYKEVLNNLGVIYLDREQLDKAREHFQAAADMNYSEAIYNLGWLHFKEGHLEAAIPHFKRALQVDPNLHTAARRLAWIYATSENESVRDVDLAGRLLSQHYDLKNTTSASVLDTAAAIQAARGRFDSAKTLAESALKLSLQRETPDEKYIADLKLRITAYENGKPWREETQP
ncbi:MAG: tetratricopeptide repeat protein, partial [Planctomycetaceae bacterium]|nr:tetratricopeptide repeat protein [Planctomycetaceae bacterium]